MLFRVEMVTIDPQDLQPAQHHDGEVSSHKRQPEAIHCHGVTRGIRRWPEP
jgi:hypothetical protein